MSRNERKQPEEPEASAPNREVLQEVKTFDDPAADTAAAKHGAYVKSGAALEAALRIVGGDASVRLLRAARRGDLELFNATLNAMEARLTRTQLKEELMVATSNFGESLVSAAAAGENEALFARAVQILDGELLRETAQQRPHGGEVFMSAARSLDLVTFKAVCNILDTPLTEAEAMESIVGKTEDDPSLFTSVVNSGSKHIVKAWAEVLSAVLPRHVMAEACAASLAACAQDPRGCLDSIPVLLAHGAEAKHEHLIRLASEFMLVELKACFIDVLASVDNPFIPGMILSVAFDDAAPKAPEAEARTLVALMEMVDDVVLEVLERLPQTIEAFPGGLSGCAAVLEPETTGERPRGFDGPLKLALHERQFTETFCVAPLVFEYISLNFVSGLPNMQDTDDILGPPKKSGKAGAPSTGPVRNGRDYLYTDGLVANGSLARLVQGMGLVAANGDGNLTSTWDRVFSGTLLPGAQFVAIGLVTKPRIYYGVAAIRMVLDFVIHLAVLAVYTAVVIGDDTGALTKTELMLIFYAMAAIYTELNEMWMGIHEYWQDKWNWLDALSLTLLATGLWLRVGKNEEWYGRAVYSLSAPLVFSRLLFYAQILPRQGLVIQMITIMISQLLHFAVVMGVIMLGFTVGFYSLFQDTSEFGVVWFRVFKAMLGEVTVFDDDIDEHSEYGEVASLLLVLYLLVLTVMLLNLLIAILSTEHARVDENAETEYRSSKIRMIKAYQRVVDNDVLPPPFNLVQLAISLPFEVIDRVFDISYRMTVMRAVGRMVFWLSTGPLIVGLGWSLWLVSTPKAVAAAWSGTNYSGKPVAFRGLCCFAVVPLHVLGIPFIIFFFWVQAGIVGLVSDVVECSSFSHPGRPITLEECFKRGDLARHVESAEIVAPQRIQTPSVANMLSAEPGGSGVRQVWEYLEDPETPGSPAMRRDEQSRPSTVEHVRALGNRLEAKSNDGVEDLRRCLGTVSASIVHMERLLCTRIVTLEQNIINRVASVEGTVGATTESRMSDLEAKLDELLRKFQG